MSLDNLKLPIELLTQLYRESLVQLDYTKPNKEKIQEKKFSILGNNQKNILLVVKDSSSLHLNDKDFQFLTGILNACKLNMADIALLNIFHYTETDFNDISETFSPTYLILFQVEGEAVNLPTSSIAYEIVQNKNIQFLSAPSLRFISENTDEKKKLWAALKKIFNL